MQQLKSLLCFSGCDHANRFGLINLAIYFAFLLVNTMFANVPALLFLLVITLAVFASASAVRRARDAGLAPIWSVAPIAVFAICSSTIALSDQGSSYFLLILAVLATVSFMVIPSRQSLSYVLGYSGPVDLFDHQQQKATPAAFANRIEPTFVDGHSESAQPQSDEHAIDSRPDHTDLPPNGVDWIEPVKNWLLANQKVSLAVGGVVTVITLILATLPLWSVEQEVIEPVAAAPQQQVIAEKIRDHALEMPNDYYLMMDENQGLIIHWPSYENDNPQYWSILTGKGETSCENLKFNDNKTFRPNLVEIENEGDHYASFSPLDTATLVKAIADKSNFTLCGFDFSLKGSSAAINSSPVFSTYLESL